MLTSNAIGIYEKALPSFSHWREAVDIARRCGYDFIEMSIDENDDRIARLWWSPSEVRAVRNAIADSGFPIRTLCLSGHRKVPFASEDRSTRERAWEMMERAMALCVELGIRLIQTPGHDVYYEPSTPATWDRYLEGLLRVCELAEAASVTVAVENADVDRVGSPDAAMELVRHCDSPWFHIYPDFGNTVAHGFDIREQFTRARHHIVAVHVKDARRNEFRRVPFGEGIVPFSDAFRTLADIGYRGPMVVEMWNESAVDPEAVIRDAREWIRRRIEESTATS